MTARNLLDFVLSVAHDPGMSAAFAADPAGTLAGAGLGDVSVAEVQGLLPLNAPPSGPNVWATSDAANAFDFDFVEPAAAPIEVIAAAPIEVTAAAPIDMTAAAPIDVTAVGAIGDPGLAHLDHLDHVDHSEYADPGHGISGPAFTDVPSDEALDRVRFDASHDGQHDGFRSPDHDVLSPGHDLGQLAPAADPHHSPLGHVDVTAPLADPAGHSALDLPDPGHQAFDSSPGASLHGESVPSLWHGTAATGDLDFGH